MLAAVASIRKSLDGVRVKVDDRDQYKPGFKFNEWEQAGVPVRMELGPRDVEAGQAVLARRDTGEKVTVSADGVAAAVRDTLDSVQNGLFAQAKRFREANTRMADDYESFKKLVEEGFVLAHWCGDADVETRIQQETGATIRCIPFEREEEKGSCVLTGRPSEGRVLFAKAY